MMLGLLAAIVAFNSFGSPYFLSVGNFVNLFQLSIEKSIVALTMALVIIGGEIDLSVASIVGLSACVMAWTFHEGVPMPLALTALAAGTVAGLNNAFLDQHREDEKPPDHVILSVAGDVGKPHSIAKVQDH